MATIPYSPLNLDLGTTTIPGFQPVTAGLSQTLGTPTLGSGVPGITGTAAAAQGTPSFLDGMMGPNGWGGAAIGLGTGLMQGFMGMQNLKLAKEQLAFQKQAYEKNLANQTKMVNTQLEDRQRARVASNPGAYQSVTDYMRNNGI